MRTENATRKKKDRRIAGLIVVIVLIVVLAGYFLLVREETPAPVITAGIVPASEPLPLPVMPEAPAPSAGTPEPEPPELPEPPEPLALPEPSEPPTSPPSLPPGPPAPPILYPIEPETSGAPLPELGESDVPVRKALDKVMGRGGSSLMMSKELIHHIVVTIDNLPRKHLPARVVPLKRAEGIFAVEGKDETLAIGAQNAGRYAGYMAAARATDSAKLVALYRHFYPLFQKAYRELGYPQGNFNDRLVTAIDDLLAAPDSAPPIRLVQPKVLFEYADADLENRSAGQKIMIRIGRENAAMVKAKLGEIRREVTR